MKKDTFRVKIIIFKTASYVLIRLIDDSADCLALDQRLVPCSFVNKGETGNGVGFGLGSQ